MCMPFVYARYGINYTDEPYQIFNALDYRHAPATYLSGFFASQWASLFGYGLFSMRCFDVVVILLSVLAGCGYMYVKTRDISLTLFAAGATSFMMSLSPIFSWNNPSTLTVLLTLYVFLIALHYRRMWLYVAVGAAAAVSALTRLPNVVIVIGVPAVLAADAAINGGWRRNMAAAAVFLLSSGLALYIAIVCAFGSVHNYMELLGVTLVTNHDLPLLVRTIVETFYGSSCYWAVIGAGAAAMYIAAKTWPHRRTAWVVALLLVAYVAGRFVFSIFEAYNQTFHHYTLGFLVTGLVWVAFKSLRSGDRGVLTVIIATVVFMVIPMAGSNVGFIKVMGAPLFPLLAALAWPYRTRVAVIYAGAIVALFMIYIPVKNYFSTYEDVGIWVADATPANRMLNGIYSDTGRVSELDELDGIIGGAKDTRLVFESDGAQRFIGYYMAGIMPPYAMHEWTDSLTDNPQHVGRCISYIMSDARPATVVVFKKGLKSAASLLETSLSALSGCSLSAETDHYKVYSYRPPVGGVVDGVEHVGETQSCP